MSNNKIMLTERQIRLLENAVCRLLDVRGRMLAERIAPELADQGDPAVIADILRYEIAAFVAHLELLSGGAGTGRREVIRPR